MSYNPQKHHRRSIRLKHFDYASEGLYFVTLICDKRTHSFGYIKNGIMCLNENGQITVEKWLESTEIRPNISLGEYVIMPDHIHGIISIDTAIAQSTVNARANFIRLSSDRLYNKYTVKKKVPRQNKGANEIRPDSGHYSKILICKQDLAGLNNQLKSMLFSW